MESTAIELLKEIYDDGYTDMRKSLSKKVEAMVTMTEFEKDLARDKEIVKQNAKNAQEDSIKCKCGDYTPRDTCNCHRAKLIRKQKTRDHGLGKSKEFQQEMTEKEFESWIYASHGRNLLQLINEIYSVARESVDYVPAYYREKNDFDSRLDEAKKELKAKHNIDLEY
jgi:hypothetical protein